MKYLFIFPLFWLISLGGSLNGQTITSDTLLIKRYIDNSERFKKAKSDSCLVSVEKALKLSKKIGSQKFISISDQLLGKYYISRENFGLATKYLLEALQIEEVRKDEVRIADLNNDIGYIYFLLEKFEKSLQYYLKALSYSIKLRDTLKIGTIYAGIGTLHLNREYCETRTGDQKKEDYNIARSYYYKALSLFNKINAESGIVKVNLNMAIIHNRLQEPEKALPFVLKAMDYYKEQHDSGGIAQTLYSLGITYRRLKQYGNAAASLKESIEIACKINDTQGIQFVYEELAQIYDDAHDYKNSRDSYVKYMTIRDSVYNNEKSKQIFELETKYQSEIKEKEIYRLKIEKDKRDIFIVILIFSIGILVLTAVLVVLNIRGKRILAEQNARIKEQKIKELEKDRKLVAINALLHGEENERGRMARELHDGLGGLLSGIKLSLTSLKGNVILPGESLGKFDHAIKLLDSSIGELRRVAHNMMPEALAKFGLKDALSDFCNDLGSKNSNHLNFQYFGNGAKIEQKFEIGLYRITQELVNNAIKYSEAEEIWVQLVQEDNRLHLTVRDNGKGFDKQILKTTKGSGLANIHSRIEALNGRIDIESEPGKGSEFLIEFRM